MSCDNISKILPQILQPSDMWPVVERIVSVQRLQEEIAAHTSMLVDLNMVKPEDYPKEKHWINAFNKGVTCRRQHCLM